MFPNQFAIYLHDTPNRELFDRDARAFSNGCVRLEDPFELAHYLLAPQLDDPEAQFQAGSTPRSERYVTLDEPIDVHITYRTVWADAGGVHFRADIYGRDARVLAALKEAGVAPAVQATAAASGGPGRMITVGALARAMEAEAAGDLDLVVSGPAEPGLRQAR
jgi:L,D-transpeptidase YcbB